MVTDRVRYRSLAVLLAIAALSNLRFLAGSLCWNYVSSRACKRGSRQKLFGSKQVLETRETPPLLNVPVYSLATIGDDGSTNMNLLTYATPVGIRPNRIWCISLYRKTLTHRNFMARRSGVLQLLQKQHQPLVFLLGGQSSADKTVNKAARSTELGFEWQEHEGIPEKLLPEAAAYLRLRLIPGEVVNAGDHDVALCNVEEMLYPISSNSNDDNDSSSNSNNSNNNSNSSNNSNDNDSSSSNDSNNLMMTADLRSLGLISEAGRAVPPDDEK
eukprot:TRINITY_DN1747_c2_g3_i1.p1 TRINITY_DN1747_c2_g3~~TRINITY_DN1747_c2_g3_i1.p1  ORF type:complete len:279 (-),score=53.20 TRINITY_DN1747_c2_g3_i1:70-885(-)